MVHCVRAPDGMGDVEPAVEGALEGSEDARAGRGRLQANVEAHLQQEEGQMKQGGQAVRVRMERGATKGGEFTGRWVAAGWAVIRVRCLFRLGCVYAP